MKQKITIVKRNERGIPVFRYTGEILQSTKKGLLISAVFGLPQVNLRVAALLPGDLFEEYYFYDKWFNIYQVHAGNTERIKVWYCNICRPMQYLDDRIEFDDLALDLLITPNGRQYILDRDEFCALKINRKERRLALEGLREVQAFFKENSVPQPGMFL